MHFDKSQLFSFNIFVVYSGIHSCQYSVFPPLLPDLVLLMYVIRLYLDVSINVSIR